MELKISYIKEALKEPVVVFRGDSGPGIFDPQENLAFFATVNSHGAGRRVARGGQALISGRRSARNTWPTDRRRRARVPAVAGRMAGVRPPPGSAACTPA